jgi:pyridoxal phosphate enzyme (YggS family)
MLNTLDNIFSKIEKARINISEHHIVKVVAVSKYSNTDDIAKLYNQGQRAFGENKVQDLIEKSDILEDIPIQWHFIGTLQTNKINHLIKLNPYLIQSLHSISIAQELDTRLKREDKTISTLLQINSSNEQSKSGVSKEEAIDIYQEIQDRFSNINLKGVMSIGALSNDTSVIQKSFEDTYNIYDKLQKNNAKICSMGMSNDFELAINCGSNMIRLGSAIFE